MRETTGDGSPNLITPGQWSRIGDIFCAAAELAAHERLRFVEREAAGDADIQSEVLSLLEHHSDHAYVDGRPTPGAMQEALQAKGMLHSEVARAVSETVHQSFDPGTLIGGRYVVDRILGSGGMGEVYQVADPQTNSVVALKILRPTLAADQALLRRFERETRLGRRLAHPNVCPVLDVGSHLDTASGRALPFFTMPLLKGETLAQRIQRVHQLAGGGMSDVEALPLIREMLLGLEAAHAAGIVHKDVKSSNVILAEGPAGVHAVVTDFGLAREAPAAGQTLAETITTNLQIAGTVAYMSPEQLSGGELTPATDVYSFGIVLYEIATGKLPFDDRHIIQSAMQRVSPAGVDVSKSLRTLTPELDPKWRSTIERCLEREPKRRFSSAKAAMEHIAPTGWRPGFLYWSRRQWKMAASFAVAALTVGLALVVTPALRTAARAVLRGDSEAVVRQITNSGHVRDVDVSPDGKLLAYTEYLNDEYRLFLRPTSGGDIVQVAGPESVIARIAFSRDGQAIYFTKKEEKRLNTYYALYRLKLSGNRAAGPMEKIAFDVDSDPSFSPDGRQFVFVRNVLGPESGGGSSNLIVAQQDGSAERVLATQKAIGFYWEARWSPDGQTIATPTARDKILLHSVQTGAVREFRVPGWGGFNSLEWLPSGDGFFASAEERPGKLSSSHQIIEVSYPQGAVTRLTHDLNNHLRMAASADARTIVVRDDLVTSRIWVAPSGRPSEPSPVYGSASAGAHGVAWTSDNRLVYADATGTGWVMNAEGTNARLFHAAQPDMIGPHSCGAHIVFAGGVGSQESTAIYLGDSDGTPRKVLEAGSVPFCTPDGKFLIFSKDGNIVKAPLEGGSPVTLFEKAALGKVSPDGKWMAMRQADAARKQYSLVVKSLDGGPDMKIARLNPRDYVWAADSKGLIFPNSHAELENLWLVPFGGAPPVQLTHFASGVAGPSALSPDGRWAYTRAEVRTDMVLIQR